MIGIVIPIYKEHLNKYEWISLKQCCNILRNYPIFIATHKKIDLASIKSAFKYEFQHVKLEFAYFEEEYFKDIGGYNKLMCNAKFYDYFKKYEYILIHQLDAFIFKDELKSWCKLGYHYVGAPWFDDFSEGKNGEGLWRVGNGGLSLRHVKRCLTILSKRGPVKGLSSIFEDYRHMGIFSKLIRVPIIALKALGIRNNIAFYLKHYSRNEDIFWSIFVPDFYKFSIPSPEKAMKFSFERNPRKLFEINDFHLPFGCHAWWRYDLDFWAPIIKKFGYDL